jgi:hypothetical protein
MPGKSFALVPLKLRAGTTDVVCEALYRINIIEAGNGAARCGKLATTGSWLLRATFLAGHFRPNLGHNSLSSFNVPCWGRASKAPQTILPGKIRFRFTLSTGTESLFNIEPASDRPLDQLKSRNRCRDGSRAQAPQFGA